MAWSEWEKVPLEHGKYGPLKDMFCEKKYRDRGGAIFRVSFNRPQRMNALTSRGWDEIITCAHAAEADKDVAVIVWTSVGDHFGVGGDVEVATESTGQYTPTHGDFNAAIREGLKPSIAAVKGYCIGGHNHFAYTCDLTIAADTTVFGQAGTKTGSPIHGQIVVSLAYHVGPKKAKEIYYLCRQYTAQQALEWGLVNTVVPPPKLDETVDQWCSDLMDICPTIIKMQKRSWLYLDSWMKEKMEHIKDEIAPNWADMDEGKEAAKAFFERRPANHWKHATKPGLVFK